MKENLIFRNNENSEEGVVEQEREFIFRTFYDQKEHKLYPYPFSSEKLFRIWVGGDRHRNSVLKLRELYRAGKEEEYQAGKSPTITPHMHFGQLYDEGKTLAECVRHSNYGILDLDHLKAQGTTAKEVAKRAKEKREELGIVYGDYGTKGPESDDSVHLVFKFDPTLSQEGNNKRIAESLGVKHDPASDSYKQGLIIPLEEEIFILDEELFTNVYEIENVIPNEGKTTAAGQQRPENGQQTTPPTEEGAPEDLVADEFSLRLWDKTCEKLCLDLNQLRDHDIPWHPNLLMILSKGLFRVISEGQMKAVIRARIPDFRDREDCNRLISEAYHVWKPEYQLSKELLDMTAEVRREMKQSAVPAKTETQEEVMTPENHVTSEAIKLPELPKKLPRTVELLLKPFERKYWEMLCVIIPPYLAALTSHFRTLYINGYTLVAPNLYAYIIAVTGGGKKNIQDLRKMIFGKNMIPARQESARKADANKEERDQNPDHKPRKYIDKKYYVEDITKVAILGAQKSLGPNGIVLLNYSEAKVLLGMKKSNVYNIDDYLMKAWDLDEYNTDRASENSMEFHGNVGATCVLTSPPEQCLDVFFKNTEEGFVRRFFVYSYTGEFDPKTPPITPLNDAEQAELDNLLCGIWKKNLALGDEVEIIELPKTYKAAQEWENRQAALFEDGELDKIELEMGGSIPHYMLRSALSLTAIEGEETDEIVEFAKWYAEAAYYYQLKHFYKRKVEDKERQERVMANTHIRPLTPQQEKNLMVWNKLGNMFLRKEVGILRKECGLSFTDGAVSKWLFDLCHVRHLIEPIEGKRGWYRKIA